MIVYLDMDGVLANIHEKIGHHTSYDVTPPEILEPEFYLSLNPFKASLAAVKELLSFKEIDLYIATKIPNANPLAATEKLKWVARYFPELKGRVFITPDKTKLIGDVLIDDDERWSEFSGEFFRFDPRNPNHSWKRALELVKSKLKNSRSLSLSSGWMSPVRLHNLSQTKIKVIRVAPFSYEFTDEGPWTSSHAKGSLEFRDIEPDHCVEIYESTMSKHECVRVEYCEWEDGEVMQNFDLESHSP
jgi:5'(3')-deoxyribonucleotidase